MHRGHRKRLRDRSLSGCELPPHEILETLLSYAIPRRNTNDLAHRLLDRFGTIEGVFAASHSELLSVRGIGERTAHFIHLARILNDRFVKDGCGRDMCLDDVEKLISYGRKLFGGLETEAVYVLLLDSRLCLSECVRIAGGAYSSAEVSLRVLCENPAVKRSTSAVIMHNHPNGSTEMSDEDRDFVFRVAELLRMEGVNVEEQLILTGDAFRSMMQETDAEPTE